MFWDRASYGDDSGSVQAELKNGVHTIYSTNVHCVVTWGPDWRGGNIDSVQIELKKGVDTVYSNDYSFEAES